MAADTPTHEKPARQIARVDSRIQSLLLKIKDGIRPAGVAHRPAWWRYVFAILLVAAAAGVRAGLLGALGTHAPYVTFYPAVIIAALYGGFSAGLLAAVLSAGAASVFWTEFHGQPFVVLDPADLLAVGVFLGSCIMVSWVCEAMHRAEQRAATAEEQARLADERKRAEEAVREAYRRLNLHVDNSPLAVVEWDSSFHITRWAGEAQDVFGWSADEVLGKRIDELPWVYDADLPLVNEVMADMLSGKRPSNVSKNRNVRKDGSIIHCEWYNTAIRDAGGQLVSVLSQVLDVTVRKRAEAALMQSEEFVRRVLDSLFVFVGVMTPEGVLIEANRAALEAAGLKLEDVLGKPCDQTYWWSWSPEVQAQLRSAIEKAARGEPSRFDVTIRLNPERLIPIDFMLSPMRDDAGRVTHLVPSAVPIEERKQMEAALREAKEDLENRVRERTGELSRTVDVLMDEVAQRTSAEQALQQRSELLRKMAAELAAAEQREKKRLARILHDHLQQLLVGAKFRAATLRRARGESLALAVAGLEAILNECIESTRSLTAELSPTILHEAGLVPALEWLGRRVKEKHGLIVQVKASQDVGMLTEDVRILLFEAVRELLFNVVKHSGVRTALVLVTRQDDRLQVVVADEGAGFDPAAVMSPRSSGGGFGLFSIRERLDLMGGSMHIEAARGKGASFCLTVPIK